MIPDYWEIGRVGHLSQGSISLLTMTEEAAKVAGKKKKRSTFGFQAAIPKKKRKKK